MATVLADKPNTRAVSISTDLRKRSLFFSVYSTQGSGSLCCGYRWLVSKSYVTCRMCVNKVQRIYGITTHLVCLAIIPIGGNVRYTSSSKSLGARLSVRTLKQAAGIFHTVKGVCS